MLALETLYSGHFTLSTLLIKPNCQLFVWFLGSQPNTASICCVTLPLSGVITKYHSDVTPNSQSLNSKSQIAHVGRIDVDISRVTGLKLYKHSYDLSFLTKYLQT